MQELDLCIFDKYLFASRWGVPMDWENFLDYMFSSLFTQQVCKRINLHDSISKR